MTKLLNRANNWLADRLADVLATMAMFWAIAFLVTLPLFWQRPESAVQWAQYVCTVFFQGVALPVLAFVAKKEGNKSTKLLRETHDTVMREIGEIKKIRCLESEEVRELKRMCNLESKLRRLPIKPNSRRT